MSNEEDDEFVVDINIDEEELELDDDVIEQFGKEIQYAIEEVVQENITQDVRMELINVLMSISSQISIDIGMDYEEFLGMADYFYEEGQDLADEEDIDLSKLN